MRPSIVASLKVLRDSNIDISVPLDHNFVIGGAANVTVTRKDYLCLRNEEFLNDVIIDFYLKYLQHGFFINDPAMQVHTISILLNRNSY